MHYIKQEKEGIIYSLKSSVESNLFAYCKSKHEQILILNSPFYKQEDAKEGGEKMF